MKKVKLNALMSVFVLLLLASCKPDCWKNNRDYRDNPGVNVENDTLTIINVIVEKGQCECHGYYEVYVCFLSNGMEVEVDEPHSRVNLRNKCLKTVQRDYRVAELKRWKRAKIGQEVIYSEHYGRKKKLKAVSFELLPLSDYTKYRIVKEVHKYDGNMSEIDGHLSGSSCLFAGSVSGNMHGESVGSKDFFVNIYFTEGEPLSVNAKINPLFLDVQPGDIIIESRRNGNVDYAIRQQ